MTVFSGSVPERKTVEYIGPGESVRVVRRALEYLKPFRSLFYIKLAMGTSTQMVILLLPWVGKIFIDNVVNQMPLTGVPGALFNPITGGDPYRLLVLVTLLSFFLIMLIGRTDRSEPRQTRGNTVGGLDQSGNTENEINRGLSNLSGLWGITEYYVALSFSQRFNHLLRSHLFRRMLRYKGDVAAVQRIGDEVFRLTSDASGLSQITYGLIVMPISFITGFLANLTVVLYFYGDIPIVVWLSVLNIPVAVMVAFVFSSGVRKRSLRMRSAGAEATSVIEEGMSAMQLVRAFGQEERESRRFAQGSWGAFKRWRQLVVFLLIMALVLTLTLGLLFRYLMLSIMTLIIDQVLTVGDLVVVFAYVVTLWVFSISLAIVWPIAQNGIAGLARVFDAMDQEQEPSAGEDVKSIEALDQGIEFDGLGFEFTPGHPVLEDISFSVRPGEMIAVVGPAGSGKSTLVSLIPRLLEPGSGRILVNGKDIREYDLTVLRKSISVVFQEEQLMSSSLRENIAFAHTGATEERIREAASIAAADEFINHFPEGYDTRLGQRGAKISAGQKQRIAIARAVLKPSSILILDQPFSALDVRTEASIVASLDKTKGEGIIFIVDQRLTAARYADRIIVLDNGRVVETGTHDELLARPDGTYQRLCRLLAGEQGA
jgi:ABC-type multidrug transport system fused ATPase/permease subunit